MSKRVLRALSPLFGLALLAGCQSGSALLGPDASQGIQGQALLGPMCPVQTNDGTCADQPYQAWLTIATVGGTFVTRVQAGGDGSFRVGLEPGRYVVHPQSGNPFPVASDQTVEVSPGSFTNVTIHFDTGIR